MLLRILTALFIFELLLTPLIFFIVLLICFLIVLSARLSFLNSYVLGDGVGQISVVPEQEVR